MLKVMRTLWVRWHNVGEEAEQSLLFGLDCTSQHMGLKGRRRSFFTLAICFQQKIQNAFSFFFFFFNKGRLYLVDQGLAGD